MKKFLRVSVQNYEICHGFDPENREIIERVEQPQPTTKLIAVDRILSVTEKFILTTYAFGRVIYWEYEGGLNWIEKDLRELMG